MTIATYHRYQAGAMSPVVFARQVLGSVQGKWVPEADFLQLLVDPATRQRHAKTHEPAASYDAHGLPQTVEHRMVPQVAAGLSLAEARLQQLMFFGIVEHRGTKPPGRELRFKTDPELQEDEAAWAARHAADREVKALIIDADGVEKWVLQSEKEHHARLVNEEIRRRQGENLRAQLAGGPIPYPNTPR